MKMPAAPPPTEPPPPPPNQTPPNPLESVAFFYGTISRETAEWILWERGCQDGLYLLRESNEDYVLSLCFEKCVLHYRINRLPDGKGVSLCGVPEHTYTDAIQLISQVEGLACRPTTPCNRSYDAMLPPTYWGLSENQVTKFMLYKSRQWGIDDSRWDCSLSQQDAHDLRVLLSKTLHEIQPWFHGALSRLEAERRVEDSGHLDGKFLVRERDDSSYALCLSHAGTIKHYKIDVLSSGEFAIQDGQTFPSLMSLVSHYTLFCDGLWCPLIEACVRPGSLDESSFLSFVSNDNKRHFPFVSNSSKLFSTLRQRGILTKIVASISPLGGSPTGGRNTRTIPRFQSNHRTFGRDTLSRLKSPPHSSKINQRKLQKASSFEHSTLPNFFAALFCSDHNQRRKGSADHKLLQELSEQTLSRQQYSQHHYHYRVTNTLRNRSPGAGVAGPVPAPRHSLVRRDYHDLPVYANRHNGEGSASDESNGVEEALALIDLDPESPCSAASAPPRSASSPTVSGATTSDDVPSSSDRRVFRLSNLDSFPQPMPLPVDISPSPPLIDFSEGCGPDDVAYEEIDSLIEKCVPIVHDAQENHTSATSSKEELEAPSVPRNPRQALEELVEHAVTETKSSLLDKKLIEKLDYFDPLCQHVLSEPPSPTKDSSATLFVIAETFTEEQSETAYKEIKKCFHGIVQLDPKSVTLKERIGCGNFGEVHKAVLCSGAVEVPCAAKMLRQSLVDVQKTDIMKEAETLASLDHPHIVRLIGMAEREPDLMMVMELAPLGPLNKYLRANKETAVDTVLRLLVQVATAMEYMEARQFVHRDLAARNVLLVNEKFAKISDFGMSRTLGLGKEYYKAEVAGKWPLKWYAPECIYYFKFSTKSDVWSYGVTLWEALSYGEKPYKNLAGQDILQMFESNKRLDMPDECPPDVYDVMWKCWAYMPEDRPSFTEVCDLMRKAVEACAPADVAL